ncbi:hypothetical protein B0H11DRAFT_2046409 [Mycena galericulata]|nr:hypothetical protein B0H11DRAFT_2046409 [Mycena galericulata]
MSRHLGPRASCTARGCPHACAAFVAENTDGSPKYSDFESPELLCFICEHTWLSHKPGPVISSQHQLFVRGGTLDGPCAGFFSLDLVWTMRAICICGFPWAVHCVAATETPLSAPHVSRTPTSVAPVPHRPAVAFANLARPAPAVVPPPRATTIAIVQQERRASIQRNLHPNEPSSSTTTPPGRKRQRMSGPPRSYADPVPTLSLLDDFASPAVAAPTTVKIMVGILPKVLDTSEDNDTLDLSSRYQWKSGGEIEKVQKRLQLANLVFEVDVSTTGPIFEEIDVAWANHCLLNRIDYATSSAAVTDTPNTKAWVLTGPKGRGATRTWVDDPKLLTRFTFTLPAIRALPFNYTPNNLGEGIFLFVAPRFRNLHGPISSLFNPSDRLPDQILAHRCFGRRVLHPILTSLADDPDPVCGPSCTNLVVPTPRRRLSDDSIFTDSSDDDVQFPDPDSLSSQIVHASPSDALLDTVGSSSTSTIITRSMRRQQWQEAATATALPISTTALFIPGPLLVSAMKLATTSIKSRSFLGASAPMDLTLNNMPGAGSYSFASWQDYILLPREAEMDEHVTITAHSIDEGARALIVLSLWLFAGRPVGLKMKEVLQEQFVSPRPTVDGISNNDFSLFALRVTIGPGIGRSPRNEVVAEAVKIMMSDGTYWSERAGYQTLRLHPSRTPIPARSCVLKATGFLFLLHFIFIGAPLPASPFLFSTIFDGRKTAAKFDPTFLSRLISADSLSIVKKIQSVSLDQPFYASQSEECVEYQYLLNIPGVDPTLISLPRSREEHDGICSSVISFMTLGTVDIEHHPDFGAVADGFNVLVDPFNGQDRPHHILEWFETPCRELILAAYDRHIKTPADILSHLEFTETNPEHNSWGDNAETVALITTFITHYLTEPGHPADPDQVIHALMGDEGNSADPLLRANLFLSVLTGSILLPVRPTWKMQCLISHDWSEDYPMTSEDGSQDYGPDVVVSFRACFKTFSITNNARLRSLLLLEEPVAGRDTSFGRWIHGQLLSSRHSFTSS